VARSIGGPGGCLGVVAIAVVTKTYCNASIRNFSMRTAGANGTSHSAGHGTIHNDANGGGTGLLSLCRQVKIAVSHR